MVVSFGLGTNDEAIKIIMARSSSIRETVSMKLYDRGIYLCRKFSMVRYLWFSRHLHRDHSWCSNVCALHADHWHPDTKGDAEKVRHPGKILWGTDGRLLLCVLVQLLYRDTDGTTHA